jgi:protein-S-isoprenylcysteine O-methyltransferase Ste14
MGLGMIVFHCGIGIWTGSPSLVGLVLLFATLLVLYIKLIEERELEIRFGSEYVEYKRNTPFLIPRLWRKRR